MEKKASDLDARRSITFEQAEGAEPLPTQLQLKELSRALRAALWNAVLSSIISASQDDGFGRYASDPWFTILKDEHVYRQHRMVDDFTSRLKVLQPALREEFESGSYIRVFGFLQYVIRHSKCPPGFPRAIDSALTWGHAAYRILDKTVFPKGSPAEEETIKRAFVDLAATEFHGARQHLRNAAQELSDGNNAGSIRESIHAVESVVSVLEPKGDFSKALAKLDAKVGIHGAMRAGFGSLYGFTSDEKGIRHPLLDLPSAQVDETDALFMIGACAAFVSYLINKSRAAGLLS